MTPRSFPARDELTICFRSRGHRLAERFALRNSGLRSFEVRSLDELQARIGEADVLLVSGLSNVLKRNGIEPAPERGKRTTWSTFLRAHRKLLAASDFFTVEVWTPKGRSMDVAGMPRPFRRGEWGACCEALPDH